GLPERRDDQAQQDRALPVHTQEAQGAERLRTDPGRPVLPGGQPGRLRREQAAGDGGFPALLRSGRGSRVRRTRGAGDPLPPRAADRDTEIAPRAGRGLRSWGRRGCVTAGRRRPTMIDLYYWPTPNGWKVSIMLEECGLEYRTLPVDIGAGDQF